MERNNGRDLLHGNKMVTARASERKAPWSSRRVESPGGNAAKQDKRKMNIATRHNVIAPPERSNINGEHAGNDVGEKSK